MIRKRPFRWPGRPPLTARQIQRAAGVTSRQAREAERVLARARVGYRPRVARPG